MTLTAPKSDPANGPLSGGTATLAWTAASTQSANDRSIQRYEYRVSSTAKWKRIPCSGTCNVGSLASHKVDLKAGSTYYRVQLATRPTAAVTVGVASSSQYVTVSPSSLTFTTGNWGTARSVTVESLPGANDGAVITHRATSSDGAYNNIRVDDVRVYARPRADAGPDKTVTENATVALDGSNSTGAPDPWAPCAGNPANCTDEEKGLPLTYEWSYSTDRTRVISDSAVLNLTAPEVSGLTTLSLVLKVTDARGRSDEDAVAVSVYNYVPVDPAPVPDPDPDPGTTPTPEPTPTPTPTPAPTPEPTSTPDPKPSSGRALVYPDRETVIETEDGMARLVVPVGAAPEVLEIRFERRDLENLSGAPPLANLQAVLAVDANTYRVGSDVPTPDDLRQGRRAVADAALGRGVGVRAGPRAGLPRGADTVGAGGAPLRDGRIGTGLDRLDTDALQHVRPGVRSVPQGAAALVRVRVRIRIRHGAAARGHTVTGPDAGARGHAVTEPDA